MRWVFTLTLVAGCASPPIPVDEKVLARGKALYVVSCAACHQPDGRGLEGVAPPLAGTRWPDESGERLARIVLHGLRGPITVAGREYNLEMPAMGFFNDDDTAAILTHVRVTWGKSAKPISPLTIQRIRGQEQHRMDSWTLEELRRIP